MERMQDVKLDGLVVVPRQQQVDGLPLVGHCPQQMAIQGPGKENLVQRIRLIPSCWTTSESVRLTSPSDSMNVAKLEVHWNYSPVLPTLVSSLLLGSGR